MTENFNHSPSGQPDHSGESLVTEIAHPDLHQQGPDAWEFKKVIREKTVLLKNASIYELYADCLPDRITYPEFPIKYYGPAEDIEKLCPPTENLASWRRENTLNITFAKPDQFTEAHCQLLVTNLNSVMAKLGRKVAGTIEHIMQACFYISEIDTVVPDDLLFRPANDESRQFRHKMLSISKYIIIDYTPQFKISDMDHPLPGSSLEKWMERLDDFGYCVLIDSLRVPFIKLWPTK